jgi:hypothetical protein
MLEARHMKNCSELSQMSIGPRKRRTGIITRWVCRIMFCSAFVVTSAAGLIGCGDEEGPKPRPIGGIDLGGAGGAPSTGSGDLGGFGGMGGGPTGCVEGTQKHCKVYVGENNGVKTCFEGVQYCTNGAWGICTTENPTP